MGQSLVAGKQRRSVSQNVCNLSAAELATEKLLSTKLNIANNVLGQENGNVKNESNAYHASATNLQEMVNELKGRVVLDRRDIQNLTLKLEQAGDDLKALQKAGDDVRVLHKKIEENQVIVGDVPLVMVPPPKERSHIADDINFQEHDILPTSRTADTYSSSGDMYDHDPADANLVMTLLGELHDLVGPKFELFGPDLRDALYDALARVLAGALPEKFRFKLMHHISPADYVIDRDEYISNVLVEGRISAYLKRGVQAQKTEPESERTSFDNFWDTPGTGRTPGVSGSRTDRPRARPVEEITHTPGRGRKSILSIPIANLLIDLRTMHDAM